MKRSGTQARSASQPCNFALPRRALRRRATVRRRTQQRVHLTFFGEVCFSLLYLVRFRRWVRLMILGQATIEALEAPNPSDARKREIKSTKKRETHPATTQQLACRRCSATRRREATQQRALRTWIRSTSIRRETPPLQRMLRHRFSRT